MFLTVPYKILPFSKQQNQKKATKTELAVCSMTITGTLRSETRRLEDAAGSKFSKRCILHMLTPSSWWHHASWTWVWQFWRSVQKVSTVPSSASIKWWYIPLKMKNHTDKERSAAASSCIETAILTLLFPRKRQRSSPSPLSATAF